MDINTLIPLSDPIPVHWGWLEFFLILTFTLHLVMMNLMMGSGLFGCFHGFTKKGTSYDMVKDASKKIPFYIAFTVNIGVAPLLFLQVLYGNFIYVSSILMAVFWLSIIFILIAAYYLSYLYDFKFHQMPNVRFVLILAATICMLVIGFFISSNMVLMISPHSWTQYFENRLGTITAISEPMLIPRYIHFVLSSTAITGLFQAFYWNWKEKEPIRKKEKINLGLKWFTHSTIAQIPIGIWFLFSLPSHAIKAFMGSNIIATCLLAMGLVLTFLCLYLSFKSKLTPLGILTTILVLTMVLLRDQLRIILLSSHFSVKDIPVQAQYSPMIMFIVSLIIGLMLIWYMLNLTRSKGV